MRERKKEDEVEGENHDRGEHCSAAYQMMVADDETHILKRQGIQIDHND
jgi:hypothetical protein